MHLGLATPPLLTCLCARAPSLGVPIPGMLETFQKANETLEKIQKNLEVRCATGGAGSPQRYGKADETIRK